MNTAADTSTLKNWDRARLGDHTLKIGSGVTPRGGEAAYLKSGIPLIRSQNVHMNRFELEGLVRISQEQDSEMADTRVCPGDVLLNITGASIGRVCLAPSQLCPANVNQHVCIIRTDPTIDPAFLSYFLASPEFQRFIVNTEAGATRQALTKGQIEDFQVPRPPLPEQRRIAGQLEQADRLRRTRRYALELTDTFLPAAFLELFGSPREAFKRWRVVRLADCCQRITDGTHLTPEFLHEGVPFIFVKNIENARIDFKTDKFISDEVHGKLYARCPVEEDDILYTIVGATYGQAAPVGAFTKFAFQRHIAHLRPNPTQVIPKFLVTMMQLPIVKTQADRWARGAAQPTINLKELKEFLIPVPPLSLQKKFAALVERVERLRAVQREALRQAEHLFASLLHRAFSG